MSYIVGTDVSVMFEIIGHSFRSVRLLRNVTIDCFVMLKRNLICLIYIGSLLCLQARK